MAGTSAHVTSEGSPHMSKWKQNTHKQKKHRSLANEHYALTSRLFGTVSCSAVQAKRNESPQDQK